MKILFVSDLHYNETWFQWLRTRAPFHDLLVIGGDLLDQNHPASQEKQIERVSAWLERLPQPALICSGNHDRVWNAMTCQWEAPQWLTKLSRATLRTQSGVTRVRGVTFQIQNFREPVALGSADIWITHMPPAGTAVSRSTTDAEDGDVHLSEVIKNRRVKVLLCGHQHTPERWRATVGRTLCLNPGFNRGAAVPNHILLDTDSSTAYWRTTDDISDYLEKIEIPLIGTRSSARLRPQRARPTPVPQPSINV